MPREEKEAKQQRDVEPVHYTYTARKKNGDGEAPGVRMSHARSRESNRREKQFHGSKYKYKIYYIMFVWEFASGCCAWLFAARQKVFVE